MTIAMQLEEKGRKQGKYENQKETVVKLFTKAEFTVAQISDYLDLDKDFVKKILKEAKLIEE